MSRHFVCSTDRKRKCEVIDRPDAVEAIAQELYVTRAEAHKAEHGDFPEDGIGLMVECLDDAVAVHERLWDEALTMDAEWTDVKQRRDGMRLSLRARTKESHD